MTLVLQQGFVDLRLLSFIMNNTPITLHFFVRHEPQHIQPGTNNLNNSSVESAQYYFILREVDNILRITTTSDSWTFNNEKRSEQSIRTVINQVANQAQTKMCTIEELRALKVLGLLSSRAQKLALVSQSTLIQILRYFNHDIHALIIESILITTLAEQRFLRNFLLNITSAVYTYNQQHSLPHDNDTSFQLLENLTRTTPKPIEAFCKKDTIGTNNPFLTQLHQLPLKTNISLQNNTIESTEPIPTTTTTTNTTMGDDDSINTTTTTTMTTTPNTNTTTTNNANEYETTNNMNDTSNTSPTSNQLTPTHNIPYPPPWGRYFNLTQSKSRAPILDLRFALILKSILRDSTILKRETVLGIWNSLILPVSKTGHILSTDTNQTEVNQKKKKYAKKGRDLNAIEVPDRVPMIARGPIPEYTLLGTQSGLDVCLLPPKSKIDNNNNNQMNYDSNMNDNTSTTIPSTNPTYNTMSMSLSTKISPPQLTKSINSNNDQIDMSLFSVDPNELLQASLQSYGDPKNGLISQCFVRLNENGESIITCTDVFPIGSGHDDNDNDHSIIPNQMNTTTSMTTPTTIATTHQQQANIFSTQPQSAITSQYRSSPSPQSPQSSPSSTTPLSLSTTLSTTNSSDSSSTTTPTNNQHNVNDITKAFNRLSLETVIETQSDQTTSLTLSYPSLDFNDQSVEGIPQPPKKISKILPQPPSHATFKITLQSHSTPSTQSSSQSPLRPISNLPSTSISPPQSSLVQSHPQFHFPIPQIPSVGSFNPLNHLITKSFQNQFSSLSAQALSTFTLLPQTSSAAREGTVYPFLQFTHRTVCLPLLISKFHPPTIQPYTCPHWLISQYPQFLLQLQRASFFKNFPRTNSIYSQGLNPPHYRSQQITTINHTVDNNNNNQIVTTPQQTLTTRDKSTTTKSSFHFDQQSIQNDIDDDDYDDQDDMDPLETCPLSPPSDSSLTLTSPLSTSSNQYQSDPFTSNLPLNSNNIKNNAILFNSSNTTTTTQPTIASNPHQAHLIAYQLEQQQRFEFEQRLITECHLAMHVPPINIHNFIPLPHSKYYQKYQHQLQLWQEQQELINNGDITTPTDSTFEPHNPLKKITALNKSVQLNLLRSIMLPANPLFSTDNILMHFRPQLMKPVESTTSFCLECEFSRHSYITQFPESTPTLRYISKFYTPQFQSPCWCKQRQLGMKYPHQVFSQIPIPNFISQHPNLHRHLVNSFSKANQLNFQQGTQSSQQPSQLTTNSTNNDKNITTKAFIESISDELYQFDPDFLTYPGVVSFSTLLALATIYYRQRNPPPASTSSSNQNDINDDTNNINDTDLSILQLTGNDPQYLNYTTTLLRESFKWLVFQLKSPVVFSTALVEFDDKANAEVFGTVLDGDDDFEDTLQLDTGMNNFNNDAQLQQALNPTMNSSPSTVATTTTMTSSSSSSSSSQTDFSTPIPPFQLQRPKCNTKLKREMSTKLIGEIDHTVPPLYLISDTSPIHPFGPKPIQNQLPTQLSYSSSSSSSDTPSIQIDSISTKGNFMDSITPGETLIEILARQLAQDVCRAVVQNASISLCSTLQTNTTINTKSNQSTASNKKIPGSSALLSQTSDSTTGSPDDTIVPLLPQQLIHRTFPYELNNDNIPLFRSLLYHLQSLPPCIKLRLFRHACCCVTLTPMDSVQFPDGSTYGRVVSSSSSSSKMNNTSNTTNQNDNTTIDKKPKKLTPAQQRLQKKQQQRQKNEKELNNGHDDDNEIDDTSDGDNGINNNLNINNDMELVHLGNVVPENTTTTTPTTKKQSKTTKPRVTKGSRISKRLSTNSDTKDDDIIQMNTTMNDDDFNNNQEQQQQQSVLVHIPLDQGNTNDYSHIDPSSSTTTSQYNQNYYTYESNHFYDTTRYPFNPLHVTNSYSSNYDQSNQMNQFYPTNEDTMLMNNNTSFDPNSNQNSNFNMNTQSNQLHNGTTNNQYIPDLYLQLLDDETIPTSNPISNHTSFSFDPNNTNIDNPFFSTHYNDINHLQQEQQQQQDKQTTNKKRKQHSTNDDSIPTGGKGSSGKGTTGKGSSGKSHGKKGGKVNISDISNFFQNSTIVPIHSSISTFFQPSSLMTHDSMNGDQPQQHMNSDIQQHSQQQYQQPLPLTPQTTNSTLLNQIDLYDTNISPFQQQQQSYQFQQQLNQFSSPNRYNNSMSTGLPLSPHQFVPDQLGTTQNNNNNNGFNLQPNPLTPVQSIQTIHHHNGPSFGQYQ